VQLNDDVYVLALPFVRDGQSFSMNLSLVVDAANGPTLIDTGLPGQQEAIAAALAEAGVRVQDLKRIALTHQDIDHVGSLHGLVQASGAQPRFAAPEVLARHPQLRAVAARFEPTAVDQALRDGVRLDVAGGVRVISTPGHTVGHICLYLERSRTLVAGDALTAGEGRLLGPNPNATPDMPTAIDSVRKLADLDVRAIVCYHGGVIEDDPSGQLRRLAEDLGATEA
jgi:glyoxylase-like metal-dependent hydrolase (beta-lactamase superfamily II)